METEQKSNIIQFPLKKRMKDISSEEFYKKSNQYDDCVELAKYCIDLLQTGLNEQDFIDPGFDFNPATNSQQHADMFVVLNLLVASFLRNVDIRHILQDDLDELLAKIQFLEADDFDPTKIK